MISVLAVSCATGDGRSASAPQSVESPRQSGSKRIVAAIWGDPQTLNPTMNSAGAGSSGGVDEVALLVHVGFADVDFTTVVEPRLGERIPSLENGLWKVSPDGRMETTFALRSDARWHDGTPVTADDLAFTIRVGQDPEAVILRDRAYGLIESVETVGARTVVVRWSAPYIFADSLFSAATVPLPQHILGPIYATGMAEFAAHPYWTSDFVGTGPYKLREFERSSHVLLQANDAYLLGRPKIDEIEVRFILDPAIIVANIMAGAIHVNLGRGPSLEQGITARDSWPEGKLDTANGGWVALFPQFVNPNPAVIADMRFRKALMHTLDRKSMADTFTGGLVSVPHAYLNPQFPEWREVEGAAVRYEYDPARAGRMIEDLGYTRGSDGFFRDSSGARLGIEMRTTADDDYKNPIFFSAADYIQRAGVGAETVIIPRQRATDREWRATRPGFEVVRQPNDLTEGAMRRMHGSEAALPSNNFRGSNRTRYDNPELNALIDRFYTTIPHAERTEALRGIIRHVSDQLPIMGMVYVVEAWLFTNRLKNFSASMYTRNAHLWDLT
jgi:peptide/nickel transport system substrate-binding protein